MLVALTFLLEGMSLTVFLDLRIEKINPRCEALVVLLQFTNLILGSPRERWIGFIGISKAHKTRRFARLVFYAGILFFAA